ncbi:MAG: phosphonate metabolism protein/1,5-bisphosphokinase (PRPP-forming) PhnN [Streptosporangiales bacterium]|nr:phosphonate metabolism protein/1,5-bisphosphokinase (PRPP-forming) PhnN [Streptosporangiales bacterium]
MSGSPLGPGAFLAVVGASGAGKDSVLSYARERCPDEACFPRRVITRPPGPGEDHQPATEAEFAAGLGRGDFAVSWRAHGLRYGIPADADAQVRAGRVVVANVSRAVLGDLAGRYQRLIVAVVTVSPRVRAQRLRARGRESDEGIGRRLSRPDPAPGHQADVVISNDGPVTQGGDALLSAIRAARRTTCLLLDSLCAIQGLTGLSGGSRPATA